MSKIRILPEILSNKIAAGEVVERPASVVKELLENALDAGATRIMIEIEKGGRSLIRVADNGCGMTRDDALLSIERYATSKIYSQDDLFAIQTLGFRGEALPSIASVARFSLVTRDRDSDAGTEIVMDGGRIRSVSAVGAPVGTMITVKQLFFNTPARRKFLKSVATEMGHVAEVVAGMALGHPPVRLQLRHNGRVVKDWIGTQQAQERVREVLGRDVQRKLLAVGSKDEHLAVQGWAGLPEVTRSTARGIYVFINGRAVRDRVVQHALCAAYAGRIMKGRYPLAVLFLEVPQGMLDVNVHPTKNEVRFVRQKQVHDAVQRAVAAALDAGDRLKWGRQPRPAATAGPAISEEKAPFEPDAEDRTPPAHVSGSPERKTVSRPHPADSERLAHRFSAPAASLFPAAPAAGQPELWQKTRFADLKIVGQFHDDYIVCEAGEDLIMIDQHAAHERIVYEELKKKRGARLASQGLLVPERVELGYREAGALEKLIPELAELGFGIEPFGGTTYVVASVPALLGTRDAAPLVVEVVEKWIESGATAMTDRALDDTLKIMACHTAVRANQRLTDREIKSMLAQLDACEQPSNCPHGRPTWVKLSRRFIDTAFKRVV